MFEVYYILLVVEICWSYSYYSDYNDYLGKYLREDDPKTPPTPKPDQNLTMSFFMSLDQYQVGATETSETVYPWIARVIHSRTSDKPHVCTAACIEKRIFITAARCIYRLKVAYITLIYQSKRLQAQSIVLSSNLSKQGYDDIGLIVVDRKYEGPWPTVKLFGIKRSDMYFDWFRKLNFSETTEDYKVVGYAHEKDFIRVISADRIFTLTELPVTVGIDICTQIMTSFQYIRGYFVPCYHSCSVNQFKNGDAQCNKYHGVEGGALINTKTNELLGVATWGSVISDQESPVGFSVPNSRKFFEDRLCAQRIRDDNTQTVKKGHYQSLCNEIYYKLSIIY